MINSGLAKVQIFPTRVSYTGSLALSIDKGDKAALSEYNHSTTQLSRDGRYALRAQKHGLTA